MSEGAGKAHERRKLQAIKGVRDILPPESALWNRVEQTAHEVFATYGFGEIRLPIFEQTELFARSIGQETDIVNKEMYTFFEGGFLDLDPLENLVKVDEEVSEAWQRGEIPQTPSNEKQLLQLHTAYHDLQALLQRQSVLTEENWKVVTKSILTIKKALERIRLQVSLRPEATASVCRAYIQHGMHTWPQPVKLYYMGPMFRRERPQKGRYRQFYQIGAEVLTYLGDLKDDALVDAEVIEMLTAYFEKLGLIGTTLQINSIGDNECRPEYVKLLRSELRRVKDELEPDSRRRIETNPLRVLDSRLKSEQAVIEKLPRIAEHLCDPCREHYAEVKKQLALRNIAYEENWRLVRGLDYYVRTTFEITAPGLGSQNAVCGGGRYDGLVEMLGGQATKGIGFAIGEDRLILALDEVATDAATTIGEFLPSFSVILQRPDVAVAGTSKETWDQAVHLAASLRKRGLSVFLPKPGTRLPRVLEMAHRSGIRVAILVGENELKQNEYGIRVLSPLDPNSPRDFLVRKDDVVQYGKIVKLRQDLERALLRLAAGKQGLDKVRNPSLMVQRLMEKELLPKRMAGAIQDVLPTLNRTIHGESLSDDSVQWALAYGNLLLNELENLSPVER